jgi:inorganic pyrophosphatase
MTDYLSIPTGEKSPEIVNAIIEIPLQSSNKYEYDKKLHVFRLDRTLHSPVHYPGDYGFIPSTLGLDNDPLDVLVLVEAPSFPGCLMEVRPIGVLRMVDQGQRDSKILAVTHNDPLYNNIHEVKQVYPHVLHSIEHFFKIYKELEGKKTEMAGWEDAVAAKTAITNCQKRFSQARGKAAVS